MIESAGSNVPSALFCKSPFLDSIYYYTEEVWITWFICFDTGSQAVAQVSHKLTVLTPQERDNRFAPAQPASDSSLHTVSVTPHKPAYDIRKCFFFQPVSPSLIFTHVSRSPTWESKPIYFLSRRDAASYVNHPAASAASSRPTSSPATAPSASFLSLSGLLTNVRTLLPYARLQLSGLETPSVFCQCSTVAKPSGHLLLIFIPSSDTFQPVCNSWL